MIRKQVYLEPQQARRLEAAAARSGKSEAQIVRESLADTLGDEVDEATRASAWSALQELIRRRAEDTQPDPGPQETWTRDELHDRFERSKLGRRLSGAT